MCVHANSQKRLGGHAKAVDLVGDLPKGISMT